MILPESSSLELKQKNGGKPSYFILIKGPIHGFQIKYSTLINIKTYLVYLDIVGDRNIGNRMLETRNLVLQ